MKRSEARELLMQLLFQMSAQKDFSDAAQERFQNEYMKDSDQMDYFMTTIGKILLNIDMIDEIIENSSDNWKIKRIDQVDLAILRLSIGELLFVDSIPDSASINEAVELGKKFGGSNSGKFINGILGKVSRGKDEQ
jgi:N utilization substance protein B